MLFKIIYKNHFYHLFLLIKHMFLLQKWIPHTLFTIVAYQVEVCSTCIHDFLSCGVPCTTQKPCARPLHVLCSHPIGMCIWFCAFYIGEDAIHACMTICGHAVHSYTTCNSVGAPLLQCKHILVQRCAPTTQRHVHMHMYGPGPASRKKMCGIDAGSSLTPIYTYLGTKGPSHEVIWFPGAQRTFLDVITSRISNYKYCGNTDEHQVIGNPDNFPSLLVLSLHYYLLYYYTNIVILDIVFIHHTPEIIRSTMEKS